MSTPLWTPSSERIARANLTRFIADQRAAGAPVADYASLHRWSVDHREEFWAAVWRFADIIAEEPPGTEPWDVVLHGRDRVAPPTRELGPRWFLGARLNFAENLLRHRHERDALVSWNELGYRARLSYAELTGSVARLAAALRADGVCSGDRVAGFMPNIPEAVIAMLACASIGAIWSSCSPDFGANAVVDRFGQIRPKVLVCAAGYRYAGTRINCVPRVAEIVGRIPEIERVIVVPYEHEGTEWGAIPNALDWVTYGARGTPANLSFERRPFDHPLYIMYSSGTTGLPKCIVHGAGGTLIQLLKEHLLHADLTPRDRVFYFTTCGWMMWNWLANALAVGATLILYDGAALPSQRPAVLWDMAQDERITVFGTSAKYLALAEKANMRPRGTHQLEALRCILSTGSPLAAHSFDYVYDAVKPDVQLASISGGTDIISCFALANPIGPVWRGELQCRGLGMAVDVFDEHGEPAPVGVPGELVCTAPFPSMPIAFWDDPGMDKYRSAYFATYSNVWRHGDWAERTAHDGLIIHGRSDATLNPQGVRIGTAEIYRQVEQLDEVVESVVVAQNVPGSIDDDVRIVLFVRLRDGLTLDDALRERIRRQVRDNTSPHHVPKKIIQVADIPRTISGKITELAVRDVIHGRAVKNVEALANPRALDLFRDLPELVG